MICVLFAHINTLAGILCTFTPIWTPLKTRWPRLSEGTVEIATLQLSVVLTRVTRLSFYQFLWLLAGLFMKSCLGELLSH